MRLSRPFLFGLIFLAASFVVHIENLLKTSQGMNAVKRVRIHASLVNKPLLNYDCGGTNFGDVNVDMEERSVPNIRLIEPSPAFMPFPPESFGAADCCHVVEHVHDPRALIMDLELVADCVFIVLPSPLFPWTWLRPDHRWVFTRGRAVQLKKSEYHKIAWGFTVKKESTIFSYTI